MKPFDKTIQRMHPAGLLAALLVLVVAACDTTAPAPDPEPDAGLASAFSAGEAHKAGGVLFGGLFHRPTGEAVLTIDPSGNLVVSHIGPGGQDGFSTELGRVGGIRRTFDAIDLSGDGAAVAWQVRGVYPDSLPPLAFYTRLRNQGGTVDVWADFSALTTDLTAQIWNDSLLYYSAVVPARGLVASVKGLEEAVALRGLLSSPLGLGIAAEIEFARAVSIQIGPAPPVTGQRIRLVLPGSTQADFVREVWHFLPGAGSSRMDVVSTDVDVPGGGS